MSCNYCQPVNNSRSIEPKFTISTTSGSTDTASDTDWKNFQDQLNIVNAAKNKSCPHCGYCPHCGRGGQQYPSYPWSWPYWYNDVQAPKITWTTSTNTDFNNPQYGNF